MTVSISSNVNINTIAVNPGLSSEIKKTIWTLDFLVDII